MDNSNDYYEIDLWQFFRELWHKFWVILLAALIFGGAAFSYARFLVTPLYKAEAMMYVNNTSVSVGGTSLSISNADLLAAKNLVDTYIIILESRSTLNDVKDKANVDYTYRELKDMIDAQPVNNTEVFSVAVTSPDPQEAEKITNTIVDILPDKIADIVDGSSVRVVDYAVVPMEKDSPSIAKYTAFGALLGIIIAVLIIFIRMMNDTIIHDEDYLMDTYGLPVLAVIPDLQSDSKDSYYSGYGA